MNLFKTSIKDSLIYGGGLVLIRLSSFITLPLLTRVFTPAEYAIIGLIFTIMPFTRFVLQIEISQGVTIFFIDTKAQEEQVLYFSTGFWFTVFINLGLFGIFLLLYFISYLFSFQLFSSLSFFNIYILAMALFFDSLSYYCMNILRWQGNSKYYSFVAIVTSWSVVVFIVLFVWLFHGGLFGVFSAWLISWFLGFMLSFLRVRKFCKFVMAKNKLKQMLHFSFPLFLNNIPSQFNALLDRYVVLFILGLDAVGFYSAAVSAASIALLVPSVMRQAVWPLVYKSHKEKDAKEQISQLFYIAFFCLSGLGMIFILISKPFICIFLGHKFSSVLFVQLTAPIFLIIYLARGLNFFFPGLAIARKNKYTIVATITSLLINLILGLLLTYNFGIFGMAIALLCAGFAQLIVQARFSQRFFRLPLQINSIVVFSAIMLGLLAVTFILNLVLPGLTVGGLVTRVFLSLFFIGLTYMFYMLFRYSFFEKALRIVK